MQHGRHPPLGIIMLDIAIERPPGDVGHSASWPFDVVFRTVPGATARKIVNSDDADLMDAFVAAGDELRAEGAIGLTTSCGFLASRQGELSARMNLPLATSSLLQLAMVEPPSVRPPRRRRHLRFGGVDGQTFCRSRRRSRDASRRPSAGR